MTNYLKRDNRGFTIVEITVIVFVLAILTAAIALGLNTAMSDARDQRRTANSTAIAEKLEAYYLKNGEYPSVPAVAVDKGADQTAVSSLLDIDAASLKMPRSSTELSIVSTEGPSIGAEDVIVYDASNTVNKAICTTERSGSCDLFTLRYQNESGEEIEIRSRHDNTSFATVSIAPQRPSISLGQNENRVEGESTNPSCDTNADRLVAKYRFRYQINSGSWVWGNWQTSNTFGLTGTEGAKYSMHVMTRCDDGPVAGVESITSDTDTYTYPIGAPATPVVTVALNGNSRVQATSSVVTCPAGTVTQYASRSRTNDGAWSSYGAFSTSRLSVEITPTAGAKYGFSFQARCYNSGAGTTSGAASSAEKTYIQPLPTPGAPSVSVNAGTKTWTWSAATCASSAAKEYRYQFTSSGATAGAWITTTATSARNAAASQGIGYGLNVQTRCKTNYTTSGWSGNAYTPFTTPVVHAQLLNWAIKMNGKPDDGIARVKLKTYSISCASGLQREALLKISWNSPGRSNAWVDASTWITANANTELNLVDDLWSGWIIGGEMMEVIEYTRCRNTTTNYTSDSGGATSSRSKYDIGNLHMTEDGKRYKIACGVNTSITAYCAAGHSANGTLTNSSLTNCALHTNGISNSSQRYSAVFALGANPPCY